MFATHVREGDISLEEVAARFTVEDYVPKLDGLPDDLSWESFVKQYGAGRFRELSAAAGRHFPSHPRPAALPVPEGAKKK